MPLFLSVAVAGLVLQLGHMAMVALGAVVVALIREALVAAHALAAVAVGLLVGRAEIRQAAARVEVEQVSYIPEVAVWVGVVVEILEIMQTDLLEMVALAQSFSIGQKDINHEIRMD
jgi:flagellar biosynthesis protein FliQ